MINKGSLVHLPSHAVLYNNLGKTFNYHEMKEPGIGIVVEKTETHYKVSYNGNTWFVKKAEVYLIEEGEYDDCQAS